MIVQIGLRNMFTPSTRRRKGKGEAKKGPIVPGSQISFIVCSPDVVIDTLIRRLKSKHE
jgi:hypothetical protein